MFEWYFPWSHLDFLLRAQVIVWMLVILVSYWITWRTVFCGKRWLKSRIDLDED